MHYLLIPYFSIFLLYFIFVTRYNDIKAKRGTIYLLMIALVFLGGAILLQPLEGIDSIRYNQNFLILKNLSFWEMNALEYPPYAFRLINWLVGQFTSDYHVLFFVFFIIYIFIFYKALKNIYPSFERYYIFMAYMMYPFFIGYLMNVKKHGLGLVFMLLAISYFFKNQNIKGAASLIISVLFHKAMLLVFLPIFLFVWLKEKNILKIASPIYIILLIFSISGLGEYLQNNEVLLDYLQLENRFQGYLSTETATYYKTGFRLDFALFSLIPIFLYLYFKNRINKNDKKWVTKWLGLYLLLNGIYQFFSFAPYADRFAGFSWFILPLVCYIILEPVSKKYAVLFTMLLLLAGVILLQVYTYGFLPTPRII